MYKCQQCNKEANRCTKEVFNNMNEFISICKDCIKKRCFKEMLDNGKAIMYYDPNKEIITNWLGNLKFKVVISWASDHNWLGKNSVTYGRFLVKNQVWSFKHLGDSNTIARCKRTKIKPNKIKSIF